MGLEESTEDRDRRYHFKRNRLPVLTVFAKIVRTDGRLGFTRIQREAMVSVGSSRVRPQTRHAEGRPVSSQQAPRLGRQRQKWPRRAVGAVAGYCTRVNARRRRPAPATGMSRAPRASREEQSVAAMQVDWSQPSLRCGRVMASVASMLARPATSNWAPGNGSGYSRLHPSDRMTKFLWSVA